MIFAREALTPLMDTVAGYFLIHIAEALVGYLFGLSVAYMIRRRGWREFVLLLPTFVLIYAVLTYFYERTTATYVLMDLALLHACAVWTYAMSRGFHRSLEPLIQDE